MSADPPEPSPSLRLDDVERELSRLFRRARVSSQSLAESVHPQLDAAGYGLLSAVRELTREGGDGHAADIAEILGLHKSTTSRGITALERIGLLERVTDPEDARAKVVRLTARGEQALTAAQQGRRRQFGARLTMWSDRDVRQLARLLQRLNDDLAGVSASDAASAGPSATS